MEKCRYKLFAADKWPLEGWCHSVEPILLWWLMDDDDLLISVYLWPSEMTQAVIFFLVAKSIFTCSKYIFWLLCILSECKSIYIFFPPASNNKCEVLKKKMHFWRLKNAYNLLVWNSGRTYWWQSWFVFAEDCEPSATWCAARVDWKVAGTFLALCMTCLLSSVRICYASVTLLVMLWIVQVSPVKN